MQIKNLIDTYRPAESRNVGNKAVRGGPDAGTSARQTDRVTLSAGAATLRTATTIAQNSSGVRTDRVEQIRHQVETNTYQLNSRRTAEKMVEQESGLWE